MRPFFEDFDKLHSGFVPVKANPCRNCKPLPALAFRQQSLKPCKLFPLRPEAVRGWRLMKKKRRFEMRPFFEDFDKLHSGFVPVKVRFRAKRG